MTRGNKVDLDEKGERPGENAIPMNVTIGISSRGNLVTETTSAKGSNVFHKKDIRNTKQVGNEKVMTGDNNTPIDDNLPDDYWIDMP